VAAEKLTLTDPSSGKSTDLPVIKGSMGLPTIDIARVPSELGHFTYDSGFAATAACRSSVTFIDGDEGVLLYRGYPIKCGRLSGCFLSRFSGHE
jgi:citrate synthase